MVGRGCSVVTSVGLSGSRSLSMDGVLFVESDPVRNDGVDAHRARGVSLFRPRQQQQQRPIMRDRSGTSPRLWRAVNRRSPSASKRAISPKKKRIGRLNTCVLWRKSRGYACMRLIPDT